ncbi:hypothetical protein NUW58_g7659 [Xylaria curta]|uniref:Uncharacterized protein n=1 Tax=Xylaria curta TaxID=42375 RepID=A0ACC1NGE6_9PEZI|nr:hypothetical protein NUW58_g7659 [Xylaria curta]
MPDPPRLVEHSVQTLFRAFRSWPRMLAKGIQLPPIITLSSSAMARGMVVAVMGGCRITLRVQGAVRGEAESILAKYRTYDAPTLLAAMQSLIILLVLLFFPSNRQGTLSVVPEHIFAAVQDMAGHVLSTGMLLHEEAVSITYLDCISRRRFFFSLAALSPALSAGLDWTGLTRHAVPRAPALAHLGAHRGQAPHPHQYLLPPLGLQRLPRTRHFNCLQLGRMLAPGPKWLWQAADEKTWMNLGLVMDSRIEMWLEDADEMGVLIMTIMNASQRDLSKIQDAEGNIIG